MSAESRGSLTHHGKKSHSEAVSLKANLESLRVAHTYVHFLLIGIHNGRTHEQLDSENSQYVGLT